MKTRIFVTLKNGVLDPQGKAVTNSMKNIGLAEIDGVRIGKHIRLFVEAANMAEAEQKVDWATAELMAYGSLLIDGNIVRMSGQDVQRGTFSHRHAVIRDEQTNKGHNRLNHFTEGQEKFRIYNSLLSEYGVLGFEYGYSQAAPQ